MSKEEAYKAAQRKSKLTTAMRNVKSLIVDDPNSTELKFALNQLEGYKLILMKW